jgi:energy-coupling factor transporter ATP-binding protein EcfA2
VSDAARRLAGIPDDAPKYPQGVTMARVLRDKWHRASDVGPLKYDLEHCLADLPRASATTILNWVKDYGFGGRADKGLLLTGNNGSGKTTLAKAIAHRVIETSKLATLGRTEFMVPHQPVLFIGWINYLAEVQRRMSLEARKQYDDEFYALDLRISSIAVESRKPEWQVKLAVLDDIGAEYDSGSGWAHVELNKVLRSRGHAGLLNIATTNTALQNWTTKYGPQVGSYGHEAFLEVKVATEDRRK